MHLKCRTAEKFWRICRIYEDVILIVSPALLVILKEYAIHVKFNTTRTLYIIDQKSRLVKDYISLNAKYNMFYRVIIIK